jgi:hypothetical protein
MEDPPLLLFKSDRRQNACSVGSNSPLKSQLSDSHSRLRQIADLESRMADFLLPTSWLVVVISICMLISVSIFVSANPFLDPTAPVC